mgnify:FL=1|tara:strand:+ start:379 stop:702 length:324 start_codon:yes stop_codon:yes gene_type:complete
MALPERYKKMGFTKTRQVKNSTKSGKKKMVVVKDGDKYKLIHFGDSTMGHNYSKEARKSFKARHASNIKKGPTSAAYWANKVLWAGASGSKKTPPKSQKHVKGIKRS